MRLLLAEDDAALRDTLVRGLRDQGFAVDSVADGDAAFVCAVSESYDAIVLDVLLPQRDGRVVCRALRERGVHTPVLLLTALDGPDDTIAGLDAGADDYLAKPFAFGVLLARLRALLRRRGELLPTTLTIGDLALDTQRRQVFRADMPCRSRREYTFSSISPGTPVVWSDGGTGRARLGRCTRSDRESDRRHVSRICRKVWTAAEPARCCIRGVVRVCCFADLLADQLVSEHGDMP